MSCRVLVVDDDPGIRRLTALVLTQEGHECIGAENGLEALERVEENKPDLVILDLQMPVVDGRAFYRRFREEGHEQPVIIVSAFEARRAGKELGAQAALSKPFDIDELLTVVDRFAGSQHGTATDSR